MEAKTLGRRVFLNEVEEANDFRIAPHEAVEGKEMGVQVCFLANLPTLVERDYQNLGYQSAYVHLQTGLLSRYLCIYQEPVYQLVENRASVDEL